MIIFFGKVGSLLINKRVQLYYMLRNVFPYTPSSCSIFNTIGAFDHACVSIFDSVIFCENKACEKFIFCIIPIEASNFWVAKILITQNLLPLRQFYSKAEFIDSARCWRLKRFQRIYFDSTCWSYICTAPLFINCIICLNKQCITVKAIMQMLNFDACSFILLWCTRLLSVDHFKCSC